VGEKKKGRMRGTKERGLVCERERERERGKAMKEKMDEDKHPHL
jgi:hypothetical protein